MKVVVDAFGCDHPEEFTKGIAEALNQIDDVTIVGENDSLWKQGED